jgi:hypothetical protein
MFYDCEYDPRLGANEADDFAHRGAEDDFGLSKIENTEISSCECVFFHNFAPISKADYPSFVVISGCAFGIVNICAVEILPLATTAASAARGVVEFDIVIIWASLGPGSHNSRQGAQ